MSKKELVECDENDCGRKAFKAGIWYTISNIAIKAIAIITTPIYTRLLSTKDYGIASTFTSWYSLLLIICSLDLSTVVGRAKQDYPNKLEEYIGSIQLLSGIFSAIFVAIALILIKPVSFLLDMDNIAVIILAIYLLFSPAVSFAQARYRYEYQYKQNIFILFYTTFFTAILSIALIFIFDEEKWLGRILGASLPTVMLGIYYWISGIKREKIRKNIEYWKYSLAISLPLLIHSLSLNLLSQSDRVIITKMIGADATGIYTIPYQYALLINIILNAVNQAWQPWFHDNFYRGNISLIRNKVKPLVILYAFIAIGCVSLAPEMISILAPKEYQSGVQAVPPIVVGVFCQALYSNYINIELHLKKTKYASYGTVIAALVNVVLNIIFVPIYGFVAAAYTTCLSYILLCIIHFFITRYILRIKLYDEVFFVILFTVVCSFSCLFMILFDYILLRLLIMSAIGIIFLIYNRELIFSHIKKNVN